MQCRPRRSSGFDVGAVSESAACRSSSDAGSSATRSRVVGVGGAALASDHSTNRLQTVPESLQVTARSDASVHQQHALLKLAAEFPSLATLWTATNGNFLHRPAHQPSDRSEAVLSCCPQSFGLESDTRTTIHPHPYPHTQKTRL